MIKAPVPSKGLMVTLAPIKRAYDGVNELSLMHGEKRPQWGTRRA